MKPTFPLKLCLFSSPERLRLESKKNPSAKAPALITFTKEALPIASTPDLKVGSTLYLQVESVS